MPTAAQAGFPGLLAYAWHMVMAPSGTPAPAVDAAAAAFGKVAAEPEVRRRLSDRGMRVADNNSSAYATSWLEAERTKWEGIIRETGIRTD